MRAHSLIYFAFSSCTLLVRVVDPCVDTNPTPSELCVRQGGTLKTSGHVLQTKIGDIDGDGAPDLVMRTDNSGSLKIEAILSTNNTKVTAITIDAGITENVLYFDLANMNDDLTQPAPDHLVLLTQDEAIILSQTTQAQLRIAIDGVSDQIAANGVIASTLSPKTITAGDFLTINTPENAGREIAVAYENSDAVAIGAPTPNTVNVAVFVIDPTQPIVNNAAFITQDIHDVSSVLEMEAHNVDGTVNNSADEFFLITQRSNRPEVEAVLFLNVLSLPEPERTPIATELGAIQLIDVNNNGIFDLIVGDANDQTLAVDIIQNNPNLNPSIDTTNSRELSLDASPSAVGLLSFEATDQLIAVATTDGQIKLIKREATQLTLLPGVISDTPDGFPFGFDIDHNSQDELFSSSPNGDLLHFFPVLP